MNHLFLRQNGTPANTKKTSPERMHFKVGPRLDNSPLVSLNSVAKESSPPSRQQQIEELRTQVFDALQKYSPSQFSPSASPLAESAQSQKRTEAGGETIGVSTRDVQSRQVERFAIGTFESSYASNCNTNFNPSRKQSHSSHAALTLRTETESEEDVCQEAALLNLHTPTSKDAHQEAMLLNAQIPREGETQ